MPDDDEVRREIDAIKDRVRLSGNRLLPSERSRSEPAWAEYMRARPSAKWGQAATNEVVDALIVLVREGLIGVRHDGVTDPEFWYIGPNTGVPTHA